jgi:class 3 adenylate cyclase/tetratricopeptide (TPR) repeat protein
MSGDVLTMVFTDLVNSAALKLQLRGADLSERNRAFLETILEPHRRRVAAQLAEFGGRVVNTAGDSHFLVFRSTSAAVRWAVALQTSHAQEPIATPAGPLAVTIGVHVGSPECVGEDFIGHEVDYAARVASLATAGQILLSEAAAALVRVEHIADVTLHPHGERDLKGIGRVPVFELLYGGRRPQPLKQGSIRSHNLPPLPALVGRRDLLAHLHQCLAQGGVTILKGEGGLGKTALALTAAHAAISREDGVGSPLCEVPEGPEGKGLPILFAAAVVWINCELKPSRDECLRQMAQVFFADRMEQEPIERCAERVMARWGEGGALAVLDNFESVARDVALLRWLGEVRAPARVLVTTREVPPGLHGRVIEVSELPRAEAAALFAERAKAAGMATAGQEAAVAALCEAVGDSPLAIELLAVRPVALPRLLERVQRSLATVSTRDDPTRPPRHQSVEACIALSYEHLSPRTQELLLTLSVLPDGAHADVLEAVTGIQDWDEAAEELVRASVWRFARGRYAPHPLVRQFALARLGEKRAATEGRAARALADLALAKGRQTEPGAAAPARMVDALDWLEAEWRNLVALADAAWTAQDWLTVADLAEATRFFFLVRGYWQDCERLFTRALSARRAMTPEGPDEAQAAVLNSLGNLAGLAGRWAEAERHYLDGLAIRRALGDRRGEATTLNNLGIACAAQDNLAEAESHYRESLALWQDLRDAAGEGAALNSLGHVYFEQRDWPRAEESCRRALDIWRRVGDRVGEGKTLSNLGHLCAAQARWTDARAHYEQSLAIRREVGDRAAEGSTLTRLAELQLAQGDPHGAVDTLRRAIALLEATADSRALADARDLERKVSGTFSGKGS